MLKKCLFFTVCVAAATWSIGEPALAQGPVHDQLTTRFLSEAPPAWSEYQRRAERLQGRFAHHTELAGENVLIEESSTEYKSNASGKSLVIDAMMTVNSKEEYSGTAYVVNDRYAFEARRPSPESPWYLASYVDLRRQELPRVFERRFHFNRMALFQLIRIEQVLLPDLIGKPTFKTLSCRSVQRDSRELVEVAFEWPHAMTAEEPSMVQGGEVLLDPQRLWCIDEYRVDLRLSPGGTSDAIASETFRITDGGSADSFPTGRRYELEAEGTSLGKPTRRSSSAKDDLVVPSELPADGIFTLTAYGLPERLETAATVDRRFLWMAIFGLLCLIVAVLFLRGRRKTAVAPAS